MIGRGLLTVVLVIDKRGLVLACVGLALLAPRGRPSERTSSTGTWLRGQRDFSWRVVVTPPARAGSGATRCTVMLPQDYPGAPSS